MAAFCMAVFFYGVIVDIPFIGRCLPEKPTILTNGTFGGRPINSIKQSWKSAIEKAKVTRRIRPYDLRHRFVIKALQDGADIGILAEMVGCRLETLRKHYPHVTSAMHRNTMDQITDLGMDDDA